MTTYVRFIRVATTCGEYGRPAPAIGSREGVDFVLVRMKEVEVDTRYRHF